MAPSIAIVLTSPFPCPCTSKLSQNYGHLKYQKHNLPSHKIKSCNDPKPTLSSPSTLSSCPNYLSRPRIRGITFFSSLSSSSSILEDDSNNDNSINNPSEAINGDDHNIDDHTRKQGDPELRSASNDDDDDVEEFFCRYFFGLFSRFFQRKQQVIHGFFKLLMTSLGNNVEFVVNPTLRRGINVGFTWKFQWSKTFFPLGEGFNLYILQIYKGRFMIRNLEMLVEVLNLHIEPIRLRLVAFTMGILHTMEGLNLSRDRMKRAMFALLLTVIVLLFLSLEIY